jgi:hypothetical protein
LAELETVPESVFHVDAEGSTGHIDNDVEVDLKSAIEISVDTEFIVVPAPEEVSNVVEDEEEGEESNKDGE